MALTPLQEKVGRTYDKVRNRFFGPGTTLDFIVPNARADDFDILETLVDGWWGETNNFHKTFDFFIIEPEWFQEVIRRGSLHVRLKPGGREEDAEVYAINRKTVFPPKGADVAWLVRCDQKTTSVAKFSSLRS